MPRPGSRSSGLPCSCVVVAGAVDDDGRATFFRGAVRTGHAIHGPRDSGTRRRHGCCLQWRCNTRCIGRTVRLGRDRRGDARRERCTRSPHGRRHRRRRGRIDRRDGARFRRPCVRCRCGLRGVRERRRWTRRDDLHEGRSVGRCRQLLEHARRARGAAGAGVRIVSRPAARRRKRARRLPPQSPCRKRRRPSPHRPPDREITRSTAASPSSIAPRRTPAAPENPAVPSTRR